MKKKILDAWKFLTYDIWRITEGEVNRTTFSFYNIIKTIYLCVNRFISDRLMNKASALTYSTLLAIVPMLAILFAIARGFGFDKLLEMQLRHGFGGNSEAASTIIDFVQSYLSQTKSGVFIGVGLVLLLWTVINLVSNIEVTFNRIWEVKKQRSLYRKITDYFSMLLVMPIFLIVSSGITIYMFTALKQMHDFTLLAPILKFLIRLIPYVITWIMFTGLYIFMPNTKVKFRHAFVAGLLAGTAYQVFQYLYINSQVGVSKYNAIYGSFAALPLFLLWLQISWTICLFGVQLTYAGQNIQSFSFDEDTRNISRRYRDFISILILSLIAKRFEKNEPPYTALQLSEENKIPIRLTRQVLYLLQEVKLVSEVVVTDEKSEEISYQPALDINRLSVGLLLERIDAYGSENFKIDKEETFGDEWKVFIQSKETYYQKTGDILLKDL
ncbi:MAG: YihY/virulence factor BrkB family protein [Mediterranea sp.]|jgi:membrane protein|nr:YihY/virulence factor BrkB family protein [Mediterranea sp.]